MIFDVYIMRVQFATTSRGTFYVQANPAWLPMAISSLPLATARVLTSLPSTDLHGHVPQRPQYLSSTTSLPDCHTKLHG